MERVVAVWFPADPLLGAAVAATLAATGPRLLVDLDADWADSAAVVHDDPVPAGAAGEWAEAAVIGARGVRVAIGAGLDPAVVDAVRGGGGGVVALPGVLAAAAVAAEADAIVLGLSRGFLPLRRAHRALGPLAGPAADRVHVVLADDGPSDLRRSDVERVLGRPVAAHLPAGGREVAACLERGDVPAGEGGRARGPWAEAVGGLAVRLWPDQPDQVARPGPGRAEAWALARRVARVWPRRMAVVR